MEAVSGSMGAADGSTFYLTSWSPQTRKWSCNFDLLDNLKDSQLTALADSQSS